MAEKSVTAKLDKSAKPKGIHVQSHMKWAFDLLRAKPLPSNANIPPPPSTQSLDPQFYHGGSGNMKLLYACCWYLYAVLSSSTNLDIHRSRVMNLLRKERLCHGQVEPLSSSHCQLWIAAVAIALSISEDDPRGEHVTSECLEWFRVEYAFWTVCRSSEGVWTCGGRGHMKGIPQGLNSARNEAFEVLNSGRKFGKENQYDLGAQLLYLVDPKTQSAIKDWPVEFPPMAGGFTARRWSNGDFVVVMGGSYRHKDNVHAAGVLGGERWIEAGGLDVERAARYERLGEPVIEIVTPVARLAPNGRLLE